jgi:anhydro-N-acetylmuramic acid kinase
VPREVVALVSADDVVAAVRVHADRVHDLLRRSGCGVDESVEVCESYAFALIDALVNHFTHGRRRFDANAQLASKGRSIPELLDELMRDPYLKLPPPKSTGREYYGRAHVQKLLTVGRRHRAKPNDLIRAATIFTALSIVDALNRFVLSKTKIHQLIVSGGGANNPLILAQISAALPNIEVLPSSRLGIPTDAKEAFAFALLAYETIHGRPSNLPSASGARGPAILGKISYAPPR